MSQLRNTNLDMVRVISCVAVVGLHTFLCDVSLLNSMIYYMCGFAVELFFMSSGYILVNRTRIDFGHMCKKIGNILLVTAIWNVVYYTALFAAGQMGLSKKSIPVYEIFLMIGKSLLQKGAFFHFWYFGALILVYLIHYVIARSCASPKMIRVIWIASLLFGVILQILSYVCRTSLQHSVIQTFRIWTWIQYFLLGGMLKDQIPAISEKIPKGLYCTIVVILSVAVIVYQYYMGNYILDNAHAEFFYDDPLTILWVASLFTFIMRCNLSGDHAKRIEDAVEKLVPDTMGVYILHPLLIKLISHFIALDSMLHSIVVFILVLCISFVAVTVMRRIPVVKRMITL